MTNSTCPIDGYQDGSVEFGRFFVSQRHLLFRICLRSTHGDAVEAEDLLGEATLRAVRTWASQSPIEDRVAWWATVVRNAARDLHRRRAVRKQAVEALDRIASDEAVDGASQAVARQALRDVIASMSRLTSAQRSALALRAIGAEYDEIAATLATTAASARKLVQAARQRLRTQPDGDPACVSRPVGGQTSRRISPASDDCCRSVTRKGGNRKWPCNCELPKADEAVPRAMVFP